MHISNTSFDLTQICLRRPWEFINTSSSISFHRHGDQLASLLSYWKGIIGRSQVILFLDDSASLNFLAPYLILLIFFLLHFLLSNFISRRFVKVDHLAYSCSDDENEIKTDLFYISDDCSINEDLVAGAVHGGEALFFLSEEKCYTEEEKEKEEEEEEGPLDYYTHLGNENKEFNNTYSADVKYSDHVSESKFDSLVLEDLDDKEKNVELDLEKTSVYDVLATSDHFHTPPSSIADDEDHSVLLADDDDASEHEEKKNMETCDLKEEKTSSSSDEEGLLITVKNFQRQPSKIQEADHENLGDTSTAGSTSKSSCEWRSSTHFRDSENEALFSSSSRRSSSNWETYAVYPKYDEEMVFFDRISTQKLRETECLRSIKYQPRSISERIVHKFSTKKNSSRSQHINGWGTNPYHELEAAYVAQICLAWEALNWNYNNFKRTTFGKSKENSGCPAHVAQQFQQFQVMLQRFIENEPYEYGRRPEIFARMRISNPKLLQVPEFQGSDDKEGKQDFSSRISSPEFLRIMEDVIRTFMRFLKGDREKFCCLQLLKAFGTKTKSTASSVDPTLVTLIRKAIHKKKARLKDLHKSRKCVRKRKSNGQDEMETLMGMIDMKIVSRVLRMPEINEEQLHWCEEKMTKVRFWNGAVQRDSSPLFFPAQ